MDNPVLTIEGDSIAGVWEKSLLALWKKGFAIPTEYDRPGDSPSKDATAVLIVSDPFSEPRIHLGFPGGIEDLEKYRQEVVEGVHDHWINPGEGKWTYTYHDRLFNYPGFSGNSPVDQIRYMIEKLSSSFHSRRAQAITWIPGYDPKTDDPPCLQRIWGRIVRRDDGCYFVMNTHWRSRDAYRAAFMNLFGITELQKFIADSIAERTNTEILVGRYVDIIDSYHIYGESFDDFRDRFLPMLSARDFYNPDRTKSRTMRSDDPSVLEGFAYGKKLLEMEKKTGRKGSTQV